MKKSYYIATILLVFNITNYLYSADINNVILNKLDSIKQKKTKQASDYLKISDFYFLNDSLKLAVIYSDSGISISNENDSLLGRLNRIKAYTSLYWGNYKKAQEYFNSILKNGIENKDTFLIVVGYHGKGRVYSETEMYSDAIKELRKGVSISLISDKNKIGVLYNALGIAYQGLNEIDSAIYFLKKHSYYSKLVNEQSNYLYSLINIASVYIGLDSLNTALQYLDSAKVLNSKLNNQYGEAAIFGNISNVLLKKQNFDSALFYVNKSNNISNKNNFNQFKIQNLDLLHKIYLGFNDYEKSLQYFKEFQSLKDSTFNTEELSKINAIKYQFEIEKKEAEEELFRVKYRNRTIVMISSVLATLMLFIVVILVLSRMRLKNALYEKEKEVLEEEIDIKNRKLVSKIIEENRKSESIEKLKEVYNKIDDKTNSGNIKEEIKTTLSSFEKEIKNENHWQNLKIHFEEVHPNFFKKLMEKYPELSSNDLKMCAYTKMNMSTKDIASLLSISIRSVQTSRYRIKKKMNLDKNTDFRKYIAELS